MLARHIIYWLRLLPKSVWACCCALLLAGVPGSYQAHADDNTPPFLPNLATLQEAQTGQASFLSAEQAFPVTWQANHDGWTVSFEIEPGYYLYQKRIHLSGFPSSLDINPRLSFRQQAETRFDKNFGLVPVFHNRLDIEIIHAGQSSLVLTWQGCSDQQLCYPPKTLTLHAGQSYLDKTSPHTGRAPSQRSLTHTERGLLAIWQDFVIIGASLIFTSCVIPLIPIVISLISATGNQQTHFTQGLRLSLAFVAGISSSYAVIGVLAATLGASVNLVALTQTPWVIGSVTTLIASAGVYLIRHHQPSESDQQGFVNSGTPLLSLPDFKVNDHSLSTFVLGFIAALVISPCVSAPIGGAMTAIANTTNPLLGGSAMLVMGLTMGIPVLIAGTATAAAMPWLQRHFSSLRTVCGLALLIVALVLLDRIVNDNLILGLSGIIAVATGIGLGALDTGTRNDPASQPSRNPHPHPTFRLKQTGAVLGLVIGILWLVGAAMGNQSWLLPLATTSTPGNVTYSDSTLVTLSHSETYTSASSLLAAISNGDPRVTLVEIRADWCSSCQDLSALLHSSPVQSLLSDHKLRLLHFDITHTRREQLELLAILGIFGPPALQRFMPDGSASGSPLHGVPSRQELTRWLEATQ